MAKKQNDSKKESRYLAEFNAGYANELLTRFKDGFVTPLRNLIYALETNFKIEVTEDVLRDCVTHSGIETIAAFREANKDGDPNHPWIEKARIEYIDGCINAVKAAIKPFRDGAMILYNYRNCDPELLGMVDIDEKGIVSIKEETIDFINRIAMVFTKTKDGKRLCDILYEITPLLQEFLDIIQKYIESGKPMSPELQFGVDYWFPARLFNIEEDAQGKKTIKPVEQIHFDLEDLA